MCLIILCPPGNLPRLAYVRQAIEDNPDGVGIATATGSSVAIAKHLVPDPDAIWDDLRRNADRARLVHFRFRTHGQIDLANVQPFALAADLAWAHNGVIPGFGDAARSDSREIAEDHLAGKTLGEIRARQGDLDEWFGRYNKTVAMDARGKFAIGNREAWTARGGCLYSNSGAFYRSRYAVRREPEDDWRADPFYFADHGPAIVGGKRHV